MFSKQHCIKIYNLKLIGFKKNGGCDVFQNGGCVVFQNGGCAGFCNEQLLKIWRMLSFNKYKHETSVNIITYV